MRALIRADAGPGIGSGHLMRCLALAQGFRERGIEPTIATAGPVPGFEPMLQEEGFRRAEIPHPPGSIGDAEQTRELASATGADWVVVDGYHFDALYQYVVKGSDARLLAVDDHGDAGAYVADLVLNQNLHAHTDLYPYVASHTRLLLGTDYVLLRKEFTRSRQRRTRDRARRVLITIGGSDPEPTVEVIRALAPLAVDSLEAVVVVGPSNPSVEMISAAVETSAPSMRFETNTRNMSELMSWADVAVATAGTVSWELAFMGVPFLAVVLAGNQREIAVGLDREGVAVDVGWWSGTTPEHLAHVLEELMGDVEKRRRMSAQGQRVVDGRGVARVIAHIQAGSPAGRGSVEGSSEDTVLPRALRMREVRAEDCLLLWQWANDPFVRDASFRSDPIPWEAHIRWFEASRADTSCFMYIVEDDKGLPLGQVRFTRSGVDAEVHISLAAEVRGRGLGRRALQEACDRYLKDGGPGPVIAYVKPDNPASIRAFEAAGFERVGGVIRNGNPAVKLALAVGESVP